MDGMFITPLLFIAKTVISEFAVAKPPPELMQDHGQGAKTTD